MIERATDLATSFQQTASALTNLQQDTDRQLQQTVDEVNRLSGQLQQYNLRAMQGARHDAGLNAQMNAKLEELSQYVDITALWQPDGSVSVLMNGQTPLLLLDQQYKIAVRQAPAVAGAPPSAAILGPDGKDITAATTSGQLGALVRYGTTRWDLTWATRAVRAT